MNNTATLKERLFKESLRSLRKDRTHVPYVVEFTGLPKAGKTTIIKRLTHVLEGVGLKVLYIEEAATEKVEKGFRSDLFVFNTLCALENMSCLLRSVHNKGAYDVVLLDRGIFDSTVWSEFLHGAGLLNEDLKAKIIDFLTAKSWFSQVDLIVKVDVNRETYSMRAKLGSAVKANPRFSDDYFKLLQAAYQRAELRLNYIVEAIRPKHKVISTSVLPCDANYCEAELEKECLLRSSEMFSTAAIDLANDIGAGIIRKNTEFIAVVDANVFKSKVATATEGEEVGLLVEGLFSQARRHSEPTSRLDRYPVSPVKYIYRPVAEKSESYLQLVAAAYLIKDDKYVCLRRSHKEHRKELRGKHTILIGGHVDSKDQALAAGGRNELENCLLREMSEELSNFDRPCVEPRYIFRLGSESMGSRHLGFIYEVKTNSDRIIVNMIPGAGSYDPKVEYLSRGELISRYDEFDDWSRQVIDRLPKPN